jgi:hypothetical protein
MQEIAIGSYSVCKKCVNKTTGKEYAVKVSIPICLSSIPEMCPFKRGCPLIYFSNNLSFLQIIDKLKKDPREEVEVCCVVLCCVVLCCVVLCCVVS